MTINRGRYHAVVNLEDDTVAIAGQPSPNILGFASGGKKDADGGGKPAAHSAAAGAGKAVASGVTEADFMTMYGTKMRVKDKRQMFDRYDMDHNGVLDKHEMGFVKLRIGEV